ncbi:MAG: CoA transferase, partial [Alcaligenaceae bacterium]|nr:CoA transferase [Alcaligenaceae bacterium]
YGATFASQAGPMGYPRALSAWRKPFATRDGHICVMPYTDKHWNDLLVATGNAALAQDQRFQSIAARSEHTSFVYETLCKILAEKTNAEWLALFERLQVPAANINAPEDLQHDPHLQEVGFFQHIKDDAMGNLCFPGVPVLFDGKRPPNRIPPRLGQHTEEVLNEIAVEST